MCYLFLNTRAKISLKTCLTKADESLALCPPAGWGALEAERVSFDWRVWGRPVLWRSSKSPSRAIWIWFCRVSQAQPPAGSVSGRNSALWWTEQQKTAREQPRRQRLSVIYARQVLVSTSPLADLFPTSIYLFYLILFYPLFRCSWTRREISTLDWRWFSVLFFCFVYIPQSCLLIFFYY